MATLFKGKALEPQMAEWLVEDLEARGLKCKWEHGNDPPDIVLYIEFQGKTEKWAVEITEFDLFVKWKGQLVSASTLFMPLLKLWDRVKERFSQDPNFLKSSYQFDAGVPVARDSLAELENQIVNFIREGQSFKQVLDKQGRLVIYRLPPPYDPEREDMAIYFLDDAAAFYSPNLEYSVDRILKKKFPVLSRLTEYDRKLLVIYCSYRLSWEGIKEAVKMHLTSKSEIYYPADAILLCKGDGIWSVANLGIFYDAVSFSNPGGVFHNTIKLPHWG